MNTRLILSGLAAAAALCVVPGTNGAQIFVANSGNGTIGEYTTSGATVNSALISDLNAPFGLAASGDKLFVANFDSIFRGATIGEYTTSGATVNSALISGLSFPHGIAVSGDKLFVTFAGFFVGNGTIGEYTTSGATVNPALVSGLNAPIGIAVVSAPVPDASSTWTLLLLAIVPMLGLNLLRHRRSA
jgi:DNA-binding beta-propeller fold protein YncE